MATARASKVTDLTAGLGLTQEQTGQIVDAPPRSVPRWSAGHVVPQRLNRHPLVGHHQGVLAPSATGTALVLAASEAHLGREQLEDTSCQPLTEELPRRPR